MGVSRREMRVGNHGTAGKNARNMLAQPTRAFVSPEHGFQSELDEARARAGVNTG